MNKISEKWTKFLLWVVAYANIIAYAIVGGYVFAKTDSEEVKAESKKVFIVTAIFLAIDVLFTIFNTLFNLFGTTATLLRIYTLARNMVTLTKVVCYALFAIFAVCAKKEEQRVEQVENN